MKVNADGTAAEGFIGVVPGTNIKFSNPGRSEGKLTHTPLSDSISNISVVPGMQGQQSGPYPSAQTAPQPVAEIATASNTTATLAPVPIDSNIVEEVLGLK